MNAEESPRLAGAIRTGRVTTNCTGNDDSRQARRPLHLTITSGSRADVWQLGFDAGRASGQREGYAEALREVWRRCPDARATIEAIATRYGGAS